MWGLATAEDGYEIELTQHSSEEKAEEALIMEIQENFKGIDLSYLPPGLTLTTLTVEDIDEFYQQVDRSFYWTIKEFTDGTR